MRSETAPARLTSLPSWLLNQAAAPGQRLVSERLAAVGAHRHHYSLLSALEEFGPASQASLGRRLGIDRSDMVALVNQLADAGLVRRARDTVDRRRNVVTITPAGRRRLQDLDGAVADVQHELLAPLTPGERDQLVRILTAVVDHHAGG